MVNPFGVSIQFVLSSWKLIDKLFINVLIFKIPEKLQYVLFLKKVAKKESTKFSRASGLLTILIENYIVNVNRPHFL